MYACTRFAFRLPILAAKTAFAVTATIVLLPVTLPITRASYRALRRQRPIGEEEGAEFFQALGAMVGALGTVLPIQALRGTYWDWQDAIADLRRSRSKSLS